jgi:hypothetical protein
MSDYERPTYTGGRKPGQKNKYSAATISRDIREAIHTALYIDGNPTQYFRWLKEKRPDLFVQLIGKALMKDDESSVGGLVINVVQLTANGAGPVPGVLNSPIAEHISPQRHLQLVHIGEVIDATPNAPQSEGGDE